MSDATAATKRPTLLTVICILSFIGGLYSLWEGYRSAFTDAPQRELEKVKAQMQETIDQVGADNPMVGMMEDLIATTEKNVEMAKPMGYGNIALALVSLTGVWLMWNLKKNGFWLYLLASIAGLVMLYMMLGGGGLFANISAVIGVIITAVFLVLYGVNLKFMR